MDHLYGEGNRAKVIATPANDLLTDESRAPVNVSRVDGTVQCRAFLLYIADVFVSLWSICDEFVGFYPPGWPHCPCPVHSNRKK